jgi:hypothetical protein
MTLRDFGKARRTARQAQTRLGRSPALPESRVAVLRLERQAPGRLVHCTMTAPGTDAWRR